MERQKRIAAVEPAILADGDILAVGIGGLPVKIIRRQEDAGIELPLLYQITHRMIPQVLLIQHQNAGYGL